MYNIAVILGAGSGTRMKTDKSKLLLEINGKTVIERSVEAFAGIDEIDEIIVACREQDIESFEQVLSSYELTYCFGGKTRQESVMNVVDTIDECDLLIIHDGARPLVTAQEITDTINKAKQTGAAAVGVRVKDTIKVIDDKMLITDTPNRASLIAIQTPQVFDFAKYVKACEKAKKENKDFTDDCKLIENDGGSVSVVLGKYTNIKITTPEDIPMAESIVKMRGEQ